MPPSSYVSRINQIDAVQLDQEIYKVLRNQAREIGKYQPLERIDRWQPEIDAVLKLLVWNFSLRRGKSTFGQQLLDLHYENITGAKSVLYAIFTIGPAYAREKLANAVGVDPNFTAVLDRLADLAKLLEFLNLLIFLHRGTQPRVIEYLLGIASSPSTVHKPRNIGYSYMARELLWHSLMELFTTGLPLVNFHYIKHALKKLLAPANRHHFQRSFPVIDSASKCAYCGDTPILPVHAGCRHIFCYYCLSAHFTATTEFQCTRCDAPLTLRQMQPLSA